MGEKTSGTRLTTWWSTRHEESGTRGGLCLSLVLPSVSSLESEPMLEFPNPLSPQDSYVDSTLTK